MRSPCTLKKSSPHLPQLEKACEKAMKIQCCQKKKSEANVVYIIHLATNHVLTTFLVYDLLYCYLILTFIHSHSSTQQMFSKGI